jgi:hypothetical protein
MFDAGISGKLYGLMKWVLGNCVTDPDRGSGAFWPLDPGSGSGI